MRRFLKVTGALAVLIGTAALAADGGTGPGETRMTLVVNGRNVSEAVLEIDGRSYVDLGALARVTNATVAFQANRVVFTMPVLNDPADPTHQFSRQFAKAAIAQLALDRAWKDFVAMVIRLGVPAGSWPQEYRRMAQESMMLTVAEASTPADFKFLELLQNEFANLQQWDNTTFTQRANMVANQSIDPNALSNDPLFAKISACQDGLTTMLVAGGVSDDTSCRG
jgi:hypothetical protein